MTEPLLPLLDESRTLLHEIMMGLPIDKDRRARLHDLHDRTREVCSGTKASSGIDSFGKITPSKSKVETINATVSFPVDLRDLTIPLGLSIDAACTWLKQHGALGSRDVLREIVKRKRSMQPA